MKKNVQKALFAIPILVGVYLIVRQLTKKEPQTRPTPVDPVLGGGGSGGGATSEVSNDSFPLQKGSSGTNVIRLQNAIVKIDANLLRRYGVDGKFGSETESAVVKLLGSKTVTSNQLIDLERRASAGPRPYDAPPRDPNNPFLFF